MRFACLVPSAAAPPRRSPTLPNPSIGVADPQVAATTSNWTAESATPREPPRRWRTPASSPVSSAASSSSSSSTAATGGDGGNLLAPPAAVSGPLLPLSSTLKGGERLAAAGAPLPSPVRRFSLSPTPVPGGFITREGATPDLSVLADAPHDIDAAASPLRHHRRRTFRATTPSPRTDDETPNFRRRRSSRAVAPSSPLTDDEVPVHRRRRSSHRLSSSPWVDDDSEVEGSGGSHAGLRLSVERRGRLSQSPSSSPIEGLWAVAPVVPPRPRPRRESGASRLPPGGRRSIAIPPGHRSFAGGGGRVWSRRAAGREAHRWRVGEIDALPAPHGGRRPRRWWPASRRGATDAVVVEDGYDTDDFSGGADDGGGRRGRWWRRVPAASPAEGGRPWEAGARPPLTRTPLGAGAPPEALQAEASCMAGESECGGGAPPTAPGGINPPSTMMGGMAATAYDGGDLTHGWSAGPGWVAGGRWADARLRTEECHSYHGGGWATAVAGSWTNGGGGAAAASAVIAAVENPPRHLCRVPAVVRLPALPLRRPAGAPRGRHGCSEDPDTDDDDGPPSVETDRVLSYLSDEYLAFAVA